MLTQFYANNFIMRTPVSLVSVFLQALELINVGQICLLNVFLLLANFFIFDFDINKSK